MQNIDQDKNQKFETTSLNLASTLVALGNSLVGMKKSDGHRITFEFDQNPTLDKLLDAFWNRTLSVEPNTLFEAQKFLKSCIYEGTYGAQ